MLKCLTIKISNNKRSFNIYSLGSAGATAANERMTKVHQDEEYVYPSLDLSDDEMEIAPTSLQVITIFGAILVISQPLC